MLFRSYHLLHIASVMCSIRGRYLEVTVTPLLQVRKLRLFGRSSDCLGPLGLESESRWFQTLMLYWPDSRVHNKNSSRQNHIDLKSGNGEDEVDFTDNLEAVLFCPSNKFIHKYGGYSYITKVTKLFWGQDWTDMSGERALFLQGSGWRREQREGSKVQCVLQLWGLPWSEGQPGLRVQNPSSKWHRRGKDGVSLQLTSDISGVKSLQGGRKYIPRTHNNVKMSKRHRSWGEERPMAKAGTVWVTK